MTNRPLPSTSEADELRKDFDASFAHAPVFADAATEDLLLIRVGGDPYALRLRDVGAVLTDRSVVPLPSKSPTLLGLAGVRGSLVVVHGLADILGYGRPRGTPRWLAMAPSPTAIGLAFEAFDGHVRLPLTDIITKAEGGILNRVVPTHDGIRPIIDMASLVQKLDVFGRVDSTQDI